MKILSLPCEKILLVEPKEKGYGLVEVVISESINVKFLPLVTMETEIREIYKHHLSEYLNNFESLEDIVIRDYGVRPVIKLKAVS